MRGVLPIDTESSVLVSSSKYLNNPRLREWLAMIMLRKNGPDLPPQAEMHELLGILDELRDHDRIEDMFAAERRVNLGALNYAVPDHGLLTISELVETARRIADVVDIPLICDADQGGESPLNARSTVRCYERAGITAIHIEDSRNPKHMYQGDALIPASEMADRIKAAGDSRSDADFLIIGRSDVMFDKGTVEEAIERGVTYAEAGADLYFVCMLPGADIGRITANVPIPIMDIGHAGASAEAQQGLKVKVWAGLLVQGMIGAAHEILVRLQEMGSMDVVAPHLFGFGDPASRKLLDLALREPDYMALMDRFAASQR